MDVSISSAGSVPIPNVSMHGPSVRSEARSGAPPDDSVHASRLAAVVAMIEHLTGRQVKLVPPSAYLVSASSKPEVVAPVELVHPVDLSTQTARTKGPIEVGIASVLRTGTARRMVLSLDDTGGLALHAAVDLDL